MKNVQKLRFIQLDRYINYKAIISTISGLLCFLGAFFLIQFNLSIKINIVWSLIFPLFVTLAWGRKYGLISMTFGMGAFFPFPIWAKNGWANLAIIFHLLIMVTIHGYGAEKRRQGNKSVFYNIYFLQGVYSGIYILIAITLFPWLLKFNPPLWYKDAITSIDTNSLLLIVSKALINYLFIIAFCDLLFLLPLVRKIFMLGSSNFAKNNMKIIFSFGLIAWLSSILIMCANNILIEHKPTFEWIINQQVKIIMNMIMSTLLGVFTGGFVARYFERWMEDEKLAKANEANYRNVFENINDLYSETMLDGTIVTISPSVEKILGYSAKELIGTNIADIYFNRNQRAHVIEEILEKRKLENFKISFMDKNSHRHELWYNVEVVSYADGQTRFIGAGRDVTQYMEARAKQEESEKDYKQLFNKMLNGFTVIEPVYDENNKFSDIRNVHVNPAFVRQTGKKDYEVLNKTWLEVYGFRNNYLELFEKVFQTGQSYSFEAYSPNLGNEYYQINAFKINDNQVGVIFDNITKRVKAEQELKLREEKYRNIFENIQDIYYEAQMEGTILVMSPSIKNILGYGPEEVVGRSITMLYANPRDRAGFVKRLEDGRAEYFEVEAVTKSGENKILWINAHVDTDILGNQNIIGIARDVTEHLAAKAKQEETETKYKLLFDKMMNGILEFELVYNDKNEITDVIFVDANPGFERISGFKTDDVIGKTWSEVFKYKNRYLNDYQRVLQTGEYFQFENYNSPLKKYLMSGVFRINDHRIGGVFENITERKNAEAELKRLSDNLRTIIESTDDLIWSVDKSGRNIHSNTAMRNHMKRSYNVDYESGTHPRDVFAPELAEEWVQYYERVLSEGKYQLEYKTAKGDKYLEISFNPIYKDGEVEEISVFAKDITQRKLAELEILKLNTELEQRVLERTAELQTAVSELEAFTYTVSHDLKSPLRAIDAYSRIMLEDYPQQMEGEMEEIAGNIKNISRDMIALINKLLQYSTTVRLDIYKESVKINELVSMIFSELASAIPEREIKLIMETELPPVKADKILLKQVIYNVISNAIKFTKTREMAVIKVGHFIDKGEIVLYINDNGVGFDMELSGKLFGIFQRIHSSDEFEGTGIGLATVRKIMQKHGGRTWIKGKPDQGATVYFALPVIEEQVCE
jgi:PAS domain S-box-containing protein